jgi:hypothetical protein
MVEPMADKMVDSMDLKKVVTTVDKLVDRMAYLSALTMAALSACLLG